MIRYVDHYEAGRKQGTEYFVQYSFKNNRKKSDWLDLEEIEHESSFSTFAKAKKALKAANVNCDTDVIWRIVKVDSDITVTVVA